MTKQIDELKVVTQLKSENGKLKADLVQRLCLKIFDFACSSAIKPIQNQETYPVQNVELDAAIVNR